MKPDPSEYREIIAKLLEKTQQQRVEWQRVELDSFRCTVGEFAFRVTRTDNASSPLRLTMRDGAGNEIFTLRSTDLPTSPEEEKLSATIEELYDLARRQGLRVEEKLELVSNLLDQV